MSPLLAAGLIVLSIIALGWLTLRYVDRAIQQRRPGWVDPRHSIGVYCPGAKGHKGDPGPSGSEKP